MDPIPTSASYPATCDNAVTCNKPTSTTDARGKVTTYTYDATHGGVLSVQAPGESAISYSYANWAGTSIVVPTGSTRCQNAGSCDAVTTTISYPASGNPLPSAITAAGPGASATVGYSYTPDGDVDIVSGPVAGMATRTYYDKLRRVIGVVGPDPDGPGGLSLRTVNTIYRADGLVSEVQEGTVENQSAMAGTSFQLLRKTSYGYDAAGRRTSAIVRDAGIGVYSDRTFQYDAAGRVTREKVLNYGQGADQITAFLYDSSGRLETKVTGADQPEQSWEVYAYTDNGQLASVRDGEARTTSYSYDGFDRLRQTAYMDGSTEVLTRDSGGLVTNVKLRDNRNVGYGHDDAGRVIRRTLPEADPAYANYAYAYDLLGRLTAAAGGEAGVLRSYDGLGRLRTDNTGGRTITNSYDAAGRRTRIDYSNGQFEQFSYDTTGAMTAITGNTTFAYDNLGHRVRAFYNCCSGGNWTQYSYNNGSQLTGITHHFPGGPGNGPQNSVSFGYGYNVAGQMVSKTTSNDEYVYNAAPVTRNLTFNALNQPTPADGFTHDARGNQTAAAGSVTTARTQTFTSDNKLAYARYGTNPGVWIGYDALDRLYAERVGSPSATPGIFTWNGGELSEERQSDGRTALYVYGQGTDDPVFYRDSLGSAVYLHKDERGSLIAASQASGSVYWRGSYDEYGSLREGATFGRFGYTGQVYLPEAKLNHYKARAYDPDWGRFLQTDPIGTDGGINLYGYVGGDPVNRTDPSGLKDKAGGPNPYVQPKDGFREVGRGTLIAGGSCVGCMMSSSPGNQAFNPTNSPSDRAIVASVYAWAAENVTADRASWTNQDFVQHYFDGGGRDVTLGQIGLANAFERSPSVRAIQSNFIATTLNNAYAGAHFSRTFLSNVTWQPNLFSIGDSSLFASAVCGMSSCNFSFSINDAFRDPLDLRTIVGFNVELIGGTPYGIRHQWSSEFAY